MSPSIILKAGLVALACASTAVATYVLDDEYSGSGFFDRFDFITDKDQSNGFVDYQSQSAAVGNAAQHLISYDATTGRNYMGVDHWSVVSPTARGRASVRIESKQTYQHGLFIVDLAHMPSSTCGLWPAFWTASHVNYPAQGEIDIIENIHQNTVSLETLHTYPGCSLTGNQVVNQMTGNETTWNCDDAATSSPYGSQYQNQGCSVKNMDSSSYGDSFNAAGGGIYAMEWTSKAISIWNWSPKTVPDDVTSGKPDPSKWGLPVFTSAHSTCDIDTYFKDHHLIFNTDFCGDWAGQDGIWKTAGCYDEVKYPSCAAYVAANHDVYKDAYWSINSLKVYKDKVIASSSSSTVSSTSTTSAATSGTTSGTTTARSSVTTTASTRAVDPTSSSMTLSMPYGNSTGGSGSGSGSGTTTIPMTTSTVYATSVYTITSCAATVTDCPARLGSVTTETIALYTTVCPVSATSTKTAMTTSIVYTTSVYTITSCAPTVTNCPARLGSVTTETIALYTTVCPVAATATAVPYPTTGSSTATIIKTLTYTITSCAPTVTNCPALIGQVTTAVVTSTTVIPYTVPASSFVSVGASGTGVVPVKTAAGVIPSASPITGAASGLKVGGALMAVVVSVIAMLV